MVSSMSEKSLKPSRYLLFFVTVSISLLVLSSIILLQSNTTLFITRSVLKQLLVNNSSTYFTPNTNTNTNTNTNDNRTYKLPFVTPTMNGSEVPKVIIQGFSTRANNTNHNTLVPSAPETSKVTKIRTQTLNTSIDNNGDRHNNPPFVAYTKDISKGHEISSQDSNNRNEVGELRQERINGCDVSQALLRIYMYDLSPEFHFGLLGWIGEGNKIWPDVSNVKNIPRYLGGLNMQHSIEYWLTLDLLASNTPGVRRPCSAVRVHNASQADMIFVPFFSSLSYNRQPKVHGRGKKTPNRLLQEKLFEFLMSRNEWKRRRKDHIILAHHPNSMLDVRKKLGSAMFVLADFGRYPRAVANIKKDIIAPYKHIVRTINDDSPGYDRRPILLYFQGAIYRKDGGYIRQELYYLLKDENDVHFTFGSTRGGGIHRASEGMASSKFCLNIAGDTPSSNRLFDAITSHCVPVIISDEIELPFEDVLDYSEFCIFVRASDAVRKGFLLRLLHGITPDEWTKMSKKLKDVAKHFEYQYPSKPGDAVDMIWQAVAHKRSSKFALQFKLHKQNRFHRTHLTRNVK